MTVEAVSLEELLKRVLAHRLFEVHVTKTGRIKSYDASKRLAEVEVCLNPTDPMDTTKTVTHGVIKNVPVEFPGGGGYSLTFPLKEGNGVTLHFHDHSLDEWIERGGVVDVVDLRNHHVKDASAFPGIKAKPDANLAAHADHLVLGKDDDPSLQIVIDGSFMKLSANATKFVALAEKAAGWAQVLDTVIRGSVVNEPGNGLPSVFQTALKTALLLGPTPVPSESTWGATKVKAE